MITVGTSRTPVEPMKWTRTGKVQVRERRAGGRLGAFYSVDVFRLQHNSGREALARALANLPKEGVRQ